MKIAGDAGDFDPAVIKPLVERQLGSWRHAPGQPDDPPTVPNTPIPDFQPEPSSVYLVDRPGLTQASHRLATVYSSSKEFTLMYI